MSEFLGLRTQERTTVGSMGEMLWRGEMSIPPHYSVAREVARVVLEAALELRLSSAIGWLGNLEPSLDTFN